MAPDLLDLLHVGYNLWFHLRNEKHLMIDSRADDNIIMTNTKVTPVDGGSQLRIQLPSGREVTSEVLPKDRMQWPKGLIITWCNSIRSQAGFDEQEERSKLEEKRKRKQAQKETGDIIPAPEPGYTPKPTSRTEAVPQPGEAPEEYILRNWIRADADYSRSYDETTRLGKELDSWEKLGNALNLQLPESSTSTPSTSSGELESPTSSESSGLSTRPCSDQNDE